MVFFVLTFAVCCATSLCFLWENYDKGMGLEPKLVFGSHIAANPALQEPSGGANYQLHFLPLP